jgi:hypothetical protein
MRLTKRLLLNARKWHLLVPIVPVLKNYTRKDLSRDAIAGPRCGHGDRAPGRSLRLLSWTAA